jgi:hypothetical protein
MGIETAPPVNGNFVTEGTFLAMPPCFPGVSLPPPADETRLRRIFQSLSGRDVFAATRGPAPHLLQFRPKGTHGYALDRGAPVGATEITALLSRASTCQEIVYLACAGHGGATIHRCLAAIMGHGIQEWHVDRAPYEKMLDLPVEVIEGMVGSGERIFAWGGGTGFFLTTRENRLVLEKSLQLPGILAAMEADGVTRLLSSEWKAFPLLWDSLDIGSPEKLPIHEPSPQALRILPGGFIYADSEGRIFEWRSGALRERGRIPLRPVHALCRLPDGRIFGSAGPEIAHWYLLGAEEERGWARDLGVPVSTLTARRYGLQFSDLLVGNDGEILAAEDDRNGHLWIYFPPLNDKLC